MAIQLPGANEIYVSDADYSNVPLPNVNDAGIGIVEYALRAKRDREHDKYEIGEDHDFRRARLDRLYVSASIE